VAKIVVKGSVHNPEDGQGLESEGSEE
jgi:hypothetical protein